MSNARGLVPDWIPKGCGNCKHLDPKTHMRCTAYPDGIPLPIQWGEFAHIQPLHDDHGIQWEPSDALLAELEAAGVFDPTSD